MKPAAARARRTAPVIPATARRSARRLGRPNVGTIGFQACRTCNGRSSSGKQQHERSRHGEHQGPLTNTLQPAGRRSGRSSTSDAQVCGHRDVDAPAVPPESTRCTATHRGERSWRERPDTLNRGGGPRMCDVRDALYSSPCSGREASARSPVAVQTQERGSSCSPHAARRSMMSCSTSGAPSSAP
jgi:hypothetical protein